MAGCAPNLDDGELWIPSDILFSDVPFSNKSKNVSTADYISHRHEVEAVGFCKSNNNSYSNFLQNFPPNSQVSQRCIPVDNHHGVYVSPWYLSGNGDLQQRVCYDGAASEVFFVCGRPNLGRPQVNVMQQTHGLNFQKNQSGGLLLQPKGYFSWYGFSSFTMGSRGTGVFHPRAVTKPVVIRPPNTSPKSMKKKDDCTVALKRREQRIAGQDNRKECRPSVSVERRLHKDWSY